MTCFELAWDAIRDTHAIAKELRSKDGVRQRGERIEGVEDPVADFIEASRAELIRGYGPAGEIHVQCPWSDEHSGDSGPSESAWFLAGTNGYEHGAYRCLHGHCQERGASQFEQAIGFVESLFEDLGPLPAAEQKVRDAIEKSPYILERDDYRAAALAALRDVWSLNTGAELVRANGAWYQYHATHFGEVADELIEGALLDFLDDCDGVDAKGKVSRYKPNNAALANIVKQLRALASTTAVAPSWLRGAGGAHDPRECMAMTNGILHVPTRELLPHTADFFTLNALPYAWEQAAPAACSWLHFLGEVWPDDQEAIDTLQEIIGYLLLPDTSLQKMFMFIGRPRSGKGTIGRIITALLGQHNVCSPTVSNLAGEFGLEPAIGKLLAIVPDARVGNKTDTHAFVERLLSISGEDSLNINRKNRQFWVGKLSTRVVIMGNETPRLGDVSGALPGRFIHLSFDQSFYGREDTQLENKLLAELPGILAWALQGRDRLYARGYFVQPESGRDDADDMREMGSPVAQFIEDCCELDPAATELKDALYEAYRAWSISAGLPPTAKATFARNLHAVHAGIRKTRLRARQERQQAFRGIRLNDVTRKSLHSGGF